VASADGAPAPSRRTDHLHIGRVDFEVAGNTDSPAQFANREPLGASTAQRGDRPRPLRGSMLAGTSPPCTHDDDCLRLPAAPPPRNSKAEKKESAGHRPSQLCPPCVKPFSRDSPGHHHRGVHTAENGYATDGGMNRNCQSSASTTLADYSRCVAPQIHFRQCGHRCGGARRMSSRMACRTAGKVG